MICSERGSWHLRFQDDHPDRRRDCWSPWSSHWNALLPITADLYNHLAYGWWLFVQCWATLRFSDQRGLIPTNLEVDSLGLRGTLTRSRTLGADKTRFRDLSWSAEGAIWPRRAGCRLVGNVSHPKLLSNRLSLSSANEELLRNCAERLAV